MQVGDYVRTDKGLIAKYIGINKKYKWHLFDGNIQWFYEYYRQEIDFEDWKEFIEEDVVKSSPNIIDLIEVGDYVNGYLIDYIDSERRYLRSERPYREDSSMYKDLIEKGRNYNQCLHFFAEDIKSIVTKEQFEKMEYKVGVDKK